MYMNSAHQTHISLIHVLDINLQNNRASVKTSKLLNATSSGKEVQKTPPCHIYMYMYIGVLHMYMYMYMYSVPVHVSKCTYIHVHVGA